MLSGGLGCYFPKIVLNHVLNHLLRKGANLSRRKTVAARSFGPVSGLHGPVQHLAQHLTRRLDATPPQMRRTVTMALLLRLARPLHTRRLTRLYADVRPGADYVPLTPEELIPKSPEMVARATRVKEEHPERFVTPADAAELAARLPRPRPHRQRRRRVCTASRRRPSRGGIPGGGSRRMSAPPPHTKP